jgi:hypothetical protein
MSSADLHDARESLAYWESRARGLPLRAVRRRREARAMALRWSLRVREAERSTYGDGVLGTVLMLVLERRLPLRVRRASRRAARMAIGASAAVVAGCGALVVLAVAALAQLLF